MKSLIRKSIFRCITAAALAAVLILAAGCAGTADAAGSPSSWTVADTLQQYPLAKGSVWTYTGFSTDEDAYGNLTQQEIGFRMKVLDQYSCNKAALFVLSNFLTTFDMSANAAPDSSDGLTDTSCGLLALDGKMYFISPDQILPVINQFKNKIFTPENSPLLTDDSLAFIFPMTDGSQYGNISEIERNDSMYCWTVSNIPGPSHLSVISMTTAPDVTKMVFAPGQGILSFSYHHNGTISDVELYLESYQKQ